MPVYKNHSAKVDYDPFSMPMKARSFDEINLEYLANIRDENGAYTYPSLYKKWKEIQKKKLK